MYNIMLLMYYYYYVCIFCVYCTTISDDTNSEIQDRISSIVLLFLDVYTFY